MARHDSYDWDSFEEAAAQAFWADAYISEVEELADEDFELYRDLSPGPGGDWYAVLPPLPETAERVGREFTRAFRKAATAKQIRQMEEYIDDPDRAGFLAAFGSLGAGVGLWEEGVDDAGLPRWENWDLYDEAQLIIKKEMEE